MTAVGKMLVIVNLVLGIVVMVFAGAVFQVQRNWKERVDQIQSGLSAKDAEKAELASQLEAETTKAAAAIRDKTTEVNRLNDAHQRKIATMEQTTKAVAIAGSEASKNLANYELAQRDKTALQNQVDAMRQALDALRVENKRLNTDLAQANDDKFRLQRERDRFHASYNRLLVNNNDILSFLASRGYDMVDVTRYNNQGAVAPPPKGLRAKVLGVAQIGGPGGSTSVEISVGSDDGLKEGHVLAVSSSRDRGRFLGYIKIDKVTADRATGTVSQAPPNSNIKRGDNASVPKAKL